MSRDRPRGWRAAPDPREFRIKPLAGGRRSIPQLMPASRNAAFVTVPIEEHDVIVGLRDKAKQGNARAAAQLLAWLTRFPVQQGSGEDRQDKALEDMTPDELAFAEAWANRQVNRAMRRAQGMHAARARAAETASGSQDEGATRPK
jgi:hypothetical protein